MDADGIPAPTPNNEPKKYIRTFSGDMETLKKGGAPDLTPLVETKLPATPVERLVAASPVAPVPVQQPVPVPQPNPEPVPQPIPQPAPAVPSPLQTYSGDFSNKMKETHASPVTVLAAEQDAGQGVVQEPEKKSRGGIFYIIAGVILLVISGGGVYVVYVIANSQSAPVVLTPTVSAPIFVDEREQISGTGPFLLQAIKQSVQKPLAVGAVRLLYTSETATTTSTSSGQASDSIFSALQEPAPVVLLRNIQAAGSMAGIVHIGAEQTPFFILAVTSYSNTFSSMLSWEPALPSDLNELFPAYPSEPVATTTVVTTTSKTGKIIKTVVATTTIPVITATWLDETVNNHDVRVYRDSLGRDILLYGYWNQTTLVIARDSAAFAELLDRLANSHTP